MSETAVTHPPDEYLKPAEAAARFNLGRRTIYDLMHAGEIDKVSIGTPGSRKPVLRTTAASVRAYLARNTTPARAAS